MNSSSSLLRTISSNILLYLLIRFKKVVLPDIKLTK